LTNPKIWRKISEKSMPTKHKIKIYEKLGGAYRLGEYGGEQVFNKITEVIKYKLSEAPQKYKKTSKSATYDTLSTEANLLKPSKSSVDYDVEEPVVSEEDHEVGMAMGQLEDIMKNATELKGKIGTQEKNIPGWISDHISQAMQFINQANTGYHELKSEE